MMKPPTGDFLLALILSVSSLEKNYFMHFFQTHFATASVLVFLSVHIQVPGDFLSDTPIMNVGIAV